MKYLVLTFFLIFPLISYSADLDIRPSSIKFYNNDVLTQENKLIYNDHGLVVKVIETIYDNDKVKFTRYLVINYQNNLISSKLQYDSKNNLVYRWEYLYGKFSNNIYAIIQYLGNSSKLISIDNFEYNNNILIKSNSYYYDSPTPVIETAECYYDNKNLTKKVFKSNNKVITEINRFYDSNNNLQKIEINSIEYNITTKIIYFYEKGIHIKPPIHFLY